VDLDLVEPAGVDWQVDEDHLPPRRKIDRAAPGPLAQPCSKPNDFTDLGELAHTLNAFEHHWNEIAEPFDWRFTRDDLAAHEPDLQLAA
jgi:hypothetical protein